MPLGLRIDPGPAGTRALSVCVRTRIFAPTVEQKPTLFASKVSFSRPRRLFPKPVEPCRQSADSTQAPQGPGLQPLTSQTPEAHFSLPSRAGPPFTYPAKMGTTTVRKRVDLLANLRRISKKSAAPYAPGAGGLVLVPDRSMAPSSETGSTAPTTFPLTFRLHFR